MLPLKNTTSRPIEIPHIAQTRSLLHHINIRNYLPQLAVTGGLHCAINRSKVYRFALHRNAQHTPRMYIRHGDKQTRCFRVFKPEKWEESKAAEEDLVMKLPSVAPGIFSPRESSSGSARK